jgi:hypothetical protein
MLQIIAIAGITKQYYEEISIKQGNASIAITASSLMDKRNLSQLLLVQAIQLMEVIPQEPLMAMQLHSQ